MIPPEFIDTLLARVDIVDLIDRRVPLKKAGQNYQACCPFHNEKTPSFTVSPTKQFYHCFGCGAHGTAIGFLMEYEGLGFREAVAALAQEAGLPLPAETAAAPPRPAPPPALTTLLEEAARFYRQQLKKSPRAIEYLRRRGLTGEIAARFGLGYAPEGSPLKALFADYSAPDLVTCGLVVENEGRRYDRFRDRILFPIRNIKGEIIGFGGRVLDTGEPKYLNSPETPLFHKGSEIYGLYEARQAIKATGTVIVVEGYMDVVALAQHGIEHAVATLGTASTPQHTRALLRHADRVVFAFDGDNAGRKAAWRALENTLEALKDGKDVRFLFLPEGDDPDSYVRAHGRDAFLRQIDSETLPLSAFLIAELTRNQRFDAPESRAAFLRAARPLLDRIAAPLIADLIRRELVERFALPWDLLQGEPGAAHSPVRRPPPGRRVAPSALRALARLLAMRADHHPRVERAWIDPADPLARDFLTLLDWLSQQDTPPATAVTLIEAVRGSALQPLVESLQAEALDTGEDWDWEAEFSGALAQLEADWRRRRLAELSTRPLASLSPEERAALVELGRNTRRP